MRIGKLHVNFNVGRRWHTQNKWPDTAGWRTCYFENDYDWGDTPPASDEPLEWERHTDSGVVVKFRTVSCYQIKFVLAYRTFWMEISNHTKWKEVKHVH